jgi:flagellar motor switch/type III secretory pathway protein FliN
MPHAAREATSEYCRVRVGATTAAAVRFYPRALGAVIGFPSERFAQGNYGRHATGIAGRLSAAVLRGLVNELMDSASIADWVLDEQVGRAAAGTAAAVWQRLIVVVGERDVAALELSPLLVNALVPTSVSASEVRHESCRRAIGGARVKIKAVLGAVELPLSDFVSLNPGDVIVLDTRLGGACRVEVAGVAPVAEAGLGKQGAFRAICVQRMHPTSPQTDKKN